MRRQLAGNWVTNAQLGAVCTVHTPSEYERELALKSAAAVGALICGVDLVYDRAGKPRVVEVNSCPSWKVTSQATGVDISAKLIEMIESKLDRFENGGNHNRTTAFHLR